MKKRNKDLFVFQIVFFLVGVFGYAQHSSQSDSLKKIYTRDLDRREDIALLSAIAANETNPDSIIKYSDLLLEFAETDSERLIAHIQKAGALRLKGEYNNALEVAYQGMEYALGLSDDELNGRMNIEMANIYSENKDPSNAAPYFNSGISFLRRSSDSLSLAKALFNAGDNYLNIGKLDSALVLTRESEVIFRNLNSGYLSYSLGNLSYIQFRMGNGSLAIPSIEEAINILESRGDDYPISEYLLYLVEIKIHQGDYDTTYEYARESLEKAKKYGLKEIVSSANLKLSEIAELRNDPQTSLLHYKEHIALRDSIHNIETVQDMASLRTDFEVSQKQLEVDLLNNQKRTQRIIMYSLGFVVLLIAIFYRRISKEKDRSDLLLLNILPSRTAKELKEKGKVKARKFEEVTVMFTDFEAFTKHSQDLSPEKLVKSVDYFFSAFDKIIEKYHLEKIKTIGDAYMCTGGLIRKGPLEPAKVIRAAFEIIDFVDRERESENEDIAHFRIRIGINTGPVVGGVVGTKKFAYDIWGDTVNVAARMETNSMPSRINISENTYQLVKDQFECEYRGEIDVKNKGMMNMYFVHGPKSGINNHEVLTETGNKVSSAPHRP